MAQINPAPGLTSPLAPPRQLGVGQPVSKGASPKTLSGASDMQVPGGPKEVQEQQRAAAGQAMTQGQPKFNTAPMQTTQPQPAPPVSAANAPQPPAVPVANTPPNKTGQMVPPAPTQGPATPPIPGQPVIPGQPLIEARASARSTRDAMQPILKGAHVMSLTPERKAEILGLIKGAALMQHKRAESHCGPGGLKELGPDQPAKQPVKMAPKKPAEIKEVMQESPEKAAAAPSGSPAFLLGMATGFIEEMEPNPEVMGKIASALKMNPQMLYDAYWEKIALPWLPLMAGGAAMMAAPQVIPAALEGAKTLGSAMLNPIGTLMNGIGPKPPVNMARMGGMDPKTQSMMNQMITEQGAVTGQRRSMMNDMQQAFHGGPAA